MFMCMLLTEVRAVHVMLTVVAARPRPTLGRPAPACFVPSLPSTCKQPVSAWAFRWRRVPSHTSTSTTGAKIQSARTSNQRTHRAHNTTMTITPSLAIYATLLAFALLATGGHAQSTRTPPVIVGVCDASGDTTTPSCQLRQLTLNNASVPAGGCDGDLAVEAVRRAATTAAQQAPRQQHTPCIHAAASLPDARAFTCPARLVRVHLDKTASVRVLVRRRHRALHPGHQLERASADQLQLLRVGAQRDRLGSAGTTLTG